MTTFSSTSTNGYYMSPDQAALQRTLSAIRLVQPIAMLPPDAIAPPGAYFTSAAEMEMRFAHFPKAIRATQEIAERCRFDLPLGVPHMPAIPLPPKKSLRLSNQQKGKPRANIRSRFQYVSTNYHS